MAFYNSQWMSISERCRLYYSLEGQQIDLIENQCEYDGIEQLNDFIRERLKIIKTKMKFSLAMLILMASATYAQCSQGKDVDMLVTASKLKSSGFVDGQTGRVITDLNGDGNQDVIQYTFASSTPPGTCDQADCMSNLDSSPILTFQLIMHDGKSIDASYMCTSIGVSKKTHKGLKDIFCGPEYNLRWNGEEYDTE